MDPARRITFISDRHAGIIDGVKDIFPNDFHGFCLFHMKYNLMDKLRGVNSKLQSHLVYLMTKCAYAPDKESYLQKYDILVKEGGRRVNDFLAGIPV